MLKALWLAFLLAAAVGSAPAVAQDDGPQGAGAPPAPEPGRLLNEPYLAPTGETVPRPGESQSGGTTPLDRKIQKEDKLIDRGICSNCQ